MASNPRKRLGYRMRTLLSAAFTPTVQTDPDTTSVNEESVPKISVDRDSVPRCDSKFDIRRTSAWFLRDNVRIADDVKSKPASLSFTARQKDSKNSKQPEQQDLSRQKAREVTEISLEFYEKLRNMVASTLILNSRGEFSELGLGILLLSSVNDSERVIDEVVQHLAKDLGANLICFDKDDTEELACDFARDARDEQVHSLEVFEILTRYFAVRCKRHETDDTLQRSNSSFGAILGAADTKALEGKEHDENEPAPLNKSPVLIHHKNARIMMEQFHGYKFFASMREHVRRRRAQGAAVTVITTLSTSGYSGKDDWDEVPKLRRKLGVPTYMSVEFKPTHIFNRASPLDEPCSATSSNIRRLRYWLRLLNPDLFPPGFLDLDTEWAHSLGGVERIESQRWTDHQLRHMMVQVAGMAWQKPQLTLEDVKIVLERALFEDQYSGIHADDESNHTNSASRWANFPPRVQEIIHKLEQLAFQGEQKGFPDYLGFLEYLVDPGKTEIGWSEIVLEPGYSDAIKQLVPQIGDASQDRGPPYGILKQGTIGGALLYGPPGTGKTQLARVIAAQRTDLVVICVSPADIEAFLVGETEKSIKALFHLGKMLAPSLIFIDEADSLLLARSPVNAPWNRSQVNQFLGEMDGLTKSTKAPFILLSTNLPGDLDAAVLRRLSGILYIGLPSSESRAEIFKVMLRDEVLDSDVDLADLAWKTSGFSGSDIRTLCVQAALMCETFVEDEAKNKSKRLLSRMLFERALSRVNRTVTLSVMEPIAKFAEEYDPAAYRQIKMSMSVKYTRNFELKNTWTQGMSVESSDPTSAVDESNFSSLIRKSFPKQLADELAGPEKPHTKAGPEVAEASASQETIGRGHATSLYQAETAELAEQFDSKSILGRLPPLASPKPKKLQSHHDAPGHMVGSSTVDSKLDEIATPSTNSTEHPEALRPTTEVVAAEMEDFRQ
ncbi:hypothetical protein F4677DRAFT_45485 [Hypoxylon crocopeplum]|nr:hypothetical protein F4677DRAFT_45485 [Hypoxylon crocopeplum]